jgi:hypothetical protein
MVEARGADALARFHAELRRAWGSTLRTVRWPIGARVGRV